MISFVILCFCVLLLSSNAGKAAFVNRCKVSDDACLLNSGRALLPFLAAGIPELGVPSADPIYLDSVNGNAEDLKLTFIHMQVVGVNQCKMTKLQSQNGEAYHLELECPINVTGQYTLGGKLFVVPAEGDGDFEIKTDKIKIIVDFVLAEVGGHWTMSIPEPVLRILDNGWRDLITEIGKPIIFEIIARALDGVSKFFEAVPVDELRLE